jgi:glycosyltransferase involved in cell wall biosynthesis
MGFRTPIEPWMAACDLMIAPGVGEGLGRSLVEAMIVGTPVVAADSGGHKEVIVPGENGFLATADDPADFAAKAVGLLSDRPLAKRIAERAQATAVRHYSIDRHVGTMTEIYRQTRYGDTPFSLASSSVGDSSKVGQ